MDNCLSIYFSIQIFLYPRSAHISSHVCIYPSIYVYTYIRSQCILHFVHIAICLSVPWLLHTSIHAYIHKHTHIIIVTYTCVHPCIIFSQSSAYSIYILCNYIRMCILLSLNLPIAFRSLHPTINNPSLYVNQ